MPEATYNFDELYSITEEGVTDLVEKYIDAHHLNGADALLIRRAIEERLIRFEKSCKKWPKISPNGFSAALIRSIQILFYCQIKVTPMCFLEAMQYADDVLPRLNCDLVANGYRPTDTWEIMEICGKLKAINKPVR